MNITDKYVAPFVGDLNDAKFINLGLTVRQYFAAHAPEVPPDFEWREVPRALPDGYGNKTIRKVREPAVDRMVRWRVHYADLMVKAMGGAGNES